MDAIYQLLRRIGCQAYLYDYAGRTMGDSANKWIWDFIVAIHELGLDA
jgi:hypothetical protein